MAKLLMITGLGSAKDLASGKKGAFYNTLEEFHKYWERIDVISPRIRIPKGSTFGGDDAEPLFGNIFIHSSPWPLIFHPLFFIYKILSLNKKVKFDLMTVQESPPFYNGIGAWIISVFTKVPYVLEIHHIPGYPRSANIKEKIYRQLMRLFIRFDTKRAKAIRVVNQKQVRDFLIKHGVSSEKIKYIPSLYINLEIFKPLGLQKKYDLIFVGRLVENKGINLFLETVKKTKLKAVIVGEGSGNIEKRIRHENKKYNLGINFHGYAKDSQEIAKYLNESRILIMPSFNEGGPRVVGEALACGVPVLATPVGIVPDLLKNGLGGEVIDWNANAIVRKAEGLLNDLDKYQRYSQSGPEIAKQFERKAVIQNYADKLKELI